MKKLTLLILLVSAGMFSQTINDVPVKDIDVEFIQILGYGKLFSKKVTIQIDFGQDTQFFDMKQEMLVKNAEGENIKFNSMIDALNFMSSHGYEFVQAYAFAVGNQNVYHYLMKKED